MTQQRIGVVVMAYGTPATPADIPEYYTHIRRGRPPTEAQLANLVDRYETLGGVSNLAAQTEAQRARLAEQLERIAPGRYVVVNGNRHASPFIEEAVPQLVDDRDGDPISSIVGLVLAPHYSGFSVGHYAQRLADAAEEAGLVSTTIHHWFDLDEQVQFLATAVRDALAEVDTPLSATRVVFTAHSLPERVLVDDPYPDELRAGATLIAEAVGLTDWSIAWQSAGATDDAWRGPDILEVIRDLADNGHTEGIVVCAHGFVADHLEVAYDLDVQAREVADEVGLKFARTRSLHDDPTVFGALAELVHGAASEQ